LFAIAIAIAIAIAVSNVGRIPGPGEMAVQVRAEVAGGIAFGLLVGMVVMWVRTRTTDSPSQVVSAGSGCGCWRPSAETRLRRTT
jgi:NhaP-type Na+/H+ or K+/H+ antiporter